MNKLVIHEDGIDHTYECANGFVSRCVSFVHDMSLADARKLARILNEYYRAEDRRSTLSPADGKTP